MILVHSRFRAHITKQIARLLVSTAHQAAPFTMIGRIVVGVIMKSIPLSLFFQQPALRDG